MKDSYGFSRSLQHQNVSYTVQIIPYSLATESDIKSYHLSDGEFLVHLQNSDDRRSFVVYYNERLEWDSNVSKLVMDDKDLVEKIGFLIDDYFA